MMRTADGDGRATTTATSATATTATAAPGHPEKSPMAAAFGPLLLDVGAPIGGYYLLRDAVGLGMVTALALSGVVPTARMLLAAVRDREFNGLAGLMLAVNAVGIALSFLTGDPRLMIAKDSGISSVIGIAILVSVLRGTPMMSAGLKPMLTRGGAERNAAWDRLAAEDAEFQRLERVFSAVWGTVLLAECVARVVGAYTLPVHTMVWMGSVILLAAIGLAIVLGGALATQRMEALMAAEAASGGPASGGPATAA